MGESVDVFGNLGGTLHQAMQGAAARGPLAWDSSTGATVVFRHRDVQALAHDPRVAGIGLSLFDLMGISEGPLRNWYGNLMFTTEGVAHKRLRSLVARAFTPRAAESLRHTAAHLAGEALALADARDGSVDLIERFGLLPTRVMCRLLGVPDVDVATFGDWLDDLSPVFSMMTPDQILAAERALVELLNYVDLLTMQRRTSPGPDLITALLAAEDGGEKLTHDEVVRMVANLLVAGHDTTGSQLGCSLLVVLLNMGEALRAATRPSLIGSVVSETTRMEPSLAFIPRTALASLQIEGHEIPAGSVLMLSSATANRDPATWKDPDRFHAGRFVEPGVPNVLAFGAGPHYCLGAALARLTLEESVRAVLKGGGWYQITEPASEIPWRVVLGRSPERLLVTVADR